MKAKRWLMENPVYDASFMVVGILVFLLVFLTYMRLHKEFGFIKNEIIWVHIGAFLFFVAYQALQLPYLWHFVVYFTLFHFTKQFFGLHRWYLFNLGSKIDSATSLRLDYLLWALILLPLLALHFRPDMSTIGYYSDRDTFHYSSTTLYWITTALYTTAITVWLLQEYKLFKNKGKDNAPRFFFFLTTGILFFLVGYFSQTTFEIILPIISAHGAQYFFLNGKMMHQLHKTSIKTILILTAILGGGLGYLNTLAEDSLDMNDLYLHSHDWVNILLVALVLTPLFAHYILDMFLWKSSYIKKVAASKS